MGKLAKSDRPGGDCTVQRGGVQGCRPSVSRKSAGERIGTTVLHTASCCFRLGTWKPWKCRLWGKWAEYNTQWISQLSWWLECQQAPNVILWGATKKSEGNQNVWKPFANMNNCDCVEGNMDPTVVSIARRWHCDLFGMWSPSRWGSALTRWGSWLPPSSAWLLQVKRQSQRVENCPYITI